MIEDQEYLDGIEAELQQLQEEFDRLLGGGIFDEDEPQFEDLFGDPPYKLNLGCSLDHKEDFINIDVEQRANPDLIWDLEQAPWPMPDNSVDEVLAKHIVEHIHDLKTFFKEAYRVMQNGAEFVVIVPHQCSDFYWGDPTHVRPITRGMLELLSRKACDEIRERGLSNTPLAVYWDVDFSLIEATYALHDLWKDKFDNMDDAMKAIATYNNICAEVHFKMRCIKQGF